MATKKELEELGKKFINLEIEVLNKTNTSIFDNGVYNKDYGQIEEWRSGIEQFLTFDKENGSNLNTKYYFNSLINIVNSYYVQYKEKTNRFDRLNLKVYLQISEILEQEQKILDLKRYNESKEIIESLEHLNNIVLSSYTNQLDMIEKVINDNKFKEALQVIIKGKHKQDVKESFSDGQWKTFEHLHDLIKPENKDKLEAEIKQAQQSIEEAKKRQDSYDQKKKKNEQIEELEKSNKTIKNFFANTKAVGSTIELINDCCDYFYSLVFINEFMRCLTTIGIESEFYFIKPLDLMSFSKLQSGLEDLITVLQIQNIHNKEFENTAYRYIGLELFDKSSYYNSTKNGKDVHRQFNNLLYELRTEIIETLKNKTSIIEDIFALESEFKKHLKEEKRW